MLSYRIPYLLIFLLPLTVFSQRTAYSYISPDRDQDYSFAVIGAVGSNIHIWETPRFKLPHTPAKTSIHIFVLSQDMNLIDKKDIQLDEDPISHIYTPVFMIHDHSYFVSIRYKVWLADMHIPRNLLLEISENGDLIRREPDMELPHFPKISQGSPAYAITSRDKSVFAVVAGADSATRHLRVRKSLMDDTAVAEQQFSVRAYRLTYPKISLADDSTLWVTSLAEPRAKYQSDGGIHDLLFLARLDTSLWILDKPRLAPFNAPPHNKNENYIPEYILPSDSNLFIISTGRIPNPIYNYRPINPFPRAYDPRYPDYLLPTYRSDFQSYYPQYQNTNRSLRITLASPSYAILYDTIIEGHDHGANMELDNYTYSHTDGGIELLYSQQYIHNTNGIRYFYIDQQGIKEDKDLIVDVHYHYLLFLAKKISPSSLVVPFTYKGKMGFQRLRPRMN